MNKLFFAALVLISNNAGYAQPVSVLHKPYSVQSRFLDSVRVALTDNGAYPLASMIQKSGELVSWALSNNDRALADEIKLLQLKRVCETVRNDTIQQEIIDVIIDAKAIGDKCAESNALYMLGAFYEMEHNEGLSFENFLAAYNVYSGLSAAEFPRKKEYLFKIGVEYRQNGDVNNAAAMFKEAAATSGNSIFDNTVNNALGLGYRDKGQYDSAEYYFRKVYTRATNANDSQWVGISAGNIGICYYLMGENDKAIPLLEQDITTSLVTRQIQNAMHSQYILADIYHKEHNNQLSEVTLKSALAEGEGKKFWPKYNLAASIFELLSKIYAEENDMDLAYMYLDSAKIAQDSMVAEFSQLNIVKAKEKLESVQHQMEYQQLAGEKNRQMLIRDGLIIVIIFFMATGILFISRQRLQQKRLEAEKRAAGTELEMATSQLNNFKQSVQEKNNLIEQITNELIVIKTRTEQLVDSEALQQLERSILLTDEQWDNFKVLFEKVHKGFLKRVKEKIPDITAAEIRFVALSKLKLSPREMASMLGISSNSIRNYRHRLRRKLGLDEEASIDEMVDAI